MSKPPRFCRVRAYTPGVPKLWSETIEAHRRDVRQAILDTTATLVTEHGLLSVTMSQIAEETGIGRATLYKYFPDVESILFTWHEQQIMSHFQELEEVRDRGGTALERLEGVLERFARISHQAREHNDSDLARFLGRDEHVAHAQDRVRQLITELIAEGVDAGELRDDVPPEELATYCVEALRAAASVRSRAAVGRLVGVTLSGLTSNRG
jgi:AcrR family transcriptional regulator